jgi:hypothetical protein
MDLDQALSDHTDTMLRTYDLGELADRIGGRCSCGECRWPEDGTVSDVLFRNGRHHYFDGTRCTRG